MSRNFLRSKPSTTYTDGAEDILVKIYAATSPQKEIETLLSSKLSWPLLYHLSPNRGFLFEWYPFPTGSTVLEVGAGCGAITETLVKKNIEITALELDKIRSEIIKQRLKNAKNLKVITANIADFQPKEKFNYVICVGVLEYAGTYFRTDNNDPYLGFLKKIASLLQPQGKLLLAIENRLGFKYLAGAAEDHTGRYFESINNYPSTDGVKTFGRQEIITLLAASGLRQPYFYYPYPDYKLPTIIFSDDYYPGKDNIQFPRSILPTPTHDFERRHLFSEEMFIAALEQNGLYRDFANSFLIEATLDG